MQSIVGATLPEYAPAHASYRAYGSFIISQISVFAHSLIVVARFWLVALPVLCLYYWTMSFEGIHKQIKHTFLDAFNLDCVCFTNTRNE